LNKWATASFTSQVCINLVSTVSLTVPIANKQFTPYA